MLEGLTQNLSDALSFFNRSGRMTEANIREGMRQVRQALLEADVGQEGKAEPGVKIDRTGFLTDANADMVDLFNCDHH